MKVSIRLADLARRVGDRHSLALGRHRLVGKAKCVAQALDFILGRNASARGGRLGTAHVAGRTGRKPFPFPARSRKNVGKQVQFTIHGGASDRVFPGHALIAPGAEQLWCQVGQLDIFDFHAANDHFADGIEPQPLPALAALVDGDFFQVSVECVAAAFPDDDAAVGAAPDFGFAFRRPGRSFGLGAECLRFPCAEDGDLRPPTANPFPE
ncbi:hypothetical protein [Janthinobacterium sp. SUN137]|uniref:hypothetical protein n=1 Tax=Janthinobacterium sp. SUN137 TaxID=3014789 RepID=UPI00271257C1|nr:hypothetical protein [Janthinobacterium sp. SUN137]MDO8039201.1 hypothetical protein [Janthinobacterium sp. SUN137]